MAYGYSPIYIFKEKSPEYFGILFYKNSVLFKKLNPTMSYFFGSKQFYKLVRTYLGEAAVSYFILDKT